MSWQVSTRSFREAVAGEEYAGPLAGIICLALAGILALIVSLRGTRRLRYVAFLLLIIIIALAVLKFPEAGHHLKVYKSKTVTGDMK